MASRKHRTPRLYEQKARLQERTFRQFFIKDLGHDEPTILLTNDARSTAKNIIARYAKRMLVPRFRMTCRTRGSIVSSSWRRPSSA
jgi:hypothetical protein